MSALVSRERLPQLSFGGTAIFAASAITAVVSVGARPVALAVAVALFAAGTGAFLWSYGIAIGRSRTDAIGIGGLYFLAGDVAPRHVRRQMMASLGAQTVIAVATASARPFTTLAFGVLAPVWGLGLAGLWGARYGTFSPRGDADRRRTAGR